MIIRNIRRITDDARHNAFPGACWFKGNIYISYRQGDVHGGGIARIIVLRSRDGGISWEHVAVVCGPGSMGDTHLYTDGERLFAVGFCVPEGKVTACASGAASTENGDEWTNWTRYEGTGSYILWRPEFFAGKHYCAAYTWSSKRPWGAVRWFESRDGRRWRNVREIHSGEERPSECHLEILPNGHAAMLMRCDGGVFHPYMCTSEHPFATWKMRKLTDITLVGAAVWTAGDDVYIGGRWCYEPETGARCLERDDGADNVAQIGIFRVDGNRTVFQRVLPSGPWFDLSYLGVARYPDNPRRFAISFYSDAVAPACGVDQRTHPDIYWADALFLRGVEFLRDGFRVSKRISPVGGLAAVGCPDTKDASLAFRELPARPRTDYSGFPGECDLVLLRHVIEGKPGVVCLARDIAVGNARRIRLHMGYDGAVKVWWNGAEVFAGPGTKPAFKDHTSLALESRPGTNRLTMALDTDGGNAQGVFVRWEKAL